MDTLKDFSSVLLLKHRKAKCCRNETENCAKNTFPVFEFVLAVQLGRQLLKAVCLGLVSPDKFRPKEIPG